MLKEGTKSWVNYTLRNGMLLGEQKATIGLSICIQATEELELYMRTVAKGNSNAVNEHGGLWLAPEGAAPLYVYTTDALHDSPNNGYTLNGIGQALVSSANSRSVLRPEAATGQVANISILRLVGISKPEGITIHFEGAYSREFVKSIRNALNEAIDKFLRDYIVPVSFNIQLISRE